MSFDFSFDFSVLEPVDSATKATSAEEQATLVLLKHFLQNDDQPQIVQWLLLQQQLTEVFLPYVALCDVEHWATYQEFLSTAMWGIKQQLLYRQQHPKKHLQLQHALLMGVWQELFQKMKINEQINDADIDVAQSLAILCESVPCYVGHAEVCSIAAINCFDVRTELHVNDLTHMVAMLNGTDEIKVDLAQLITLDIRSPSWSWPHLILQRESAQTDSSSKLSLKQLEAQIIAQNRQSASDPYTDLLALFLLFKQHLQQKTQHERQLLSSLTHVMLNEDELSAEHQQSAQSLQKNLRQQVTALQSLAEQVDKFCEQFEGDLQKLLPHYVKDSKRLQAKKNDLSELFDKNNRLEHWNSDAQNQLGEKNDTWYDASTNLTWMRCSLGQTWDGTTCVGTAQKYTWEEAQQAVAEMNRNGGYAGYTDWVVPDIEALQSLLRDHGRVPKIDHAIFPNTPNGFYWSASPDAGYYRDAWSVSFDYGYGDRNSRGKGTNHYVRAVRAGQ